MDIKEQLYKDLVDAMKAKDEIRTNVIRLLRWRIEKLEIDTKHELNQEELIGVLMNAARQRKDSITAYSDGNRPDLVAKETAELEIIQHYLPKEMSHDEIEKIVTEVIAETGAQGLSEGSSEGVSKGVRCDLRDLWEKTSATCPTCLSVRQAVRRG